MTVERYLRLIAGFFVMLSVALGYWVNPAWFLFTAFVGANLFQSAFTDWCPMMTILRRLGAADAEVRISSPSGTRIVPSASRASRR
jgi:hypothetical protein